MSSRADGQTLVWELLGAVSGTCATPAELPAGGWLQARVPGTVAQALDAAGVDGGDLDASDWWFRTTVQLAPVPAGGRRVLVLDGLATIAEVYVAGQPVLESDSMFLAHEVELGDLPAGQAELAICIRALAPLLAESRRPRARWRTRIADSNLRFLRTTLLGRMPGIAPGPAVAGPFREVRIEQREPPELTELCVRTRLDGADGVVEVRAQVAGAAQVSVTVAGERALLDDGVATLRLNAPAQWWPHTHGDPALHTLRLLATGGDGRERVLCERRIGFRELSFLDDPDGIPQLVAGAVPVFVRGVVWTPCPADELRATLELLRDCGLNMIRIAGTTVYERPEFHDLCDELGILVWQDAMFANFDYPIADPQFRASVEQEIEQLFDAVGWRPSLAVICGGSEVEQQAAMMGREPLAGRGELTAELLPALINAAGVDASYLPSAPSGGALPFRFDRGVAHYFGVGAYRRPLGDARAAGVRFAAECLAFANVPDDAALTGLAPGSESWKAGVPRDAGADWDFDDVRDHYLRELYGADPVPMRETDPTRYLALSRELTGELMAQVFGEWRRAASPCNGGIVLWLRDLAPGAGWGLLDHRGEPKLVLGHLRRVWAPLACWLVDEGLGGLAVHVANDGAAAVTATLRVALARTTGAPVAVAERELQLAPRSVTAFDVEELIGRFCDASWAYRFGPCAHAAAIASLTPAGGGFVAPAAWFPPGQTAAAGAGDVRVTRLTGAVEIESAGLLRGARIELPGARPAADGFAVEPGRPLRVPLARDDGRDSGRLTALNLTGPVTIEPR